MRKFIALILALTLLCSLAGCGKKQETKPAPTDPAMLNTNEALLFQAHVMAQQLGMMAGSNFMKAQEIDDKIYSLCKPFTLSADLLPFRASFTRNITPDFVNKIYNAISQHSSAAFVSAAGLLSFSYQICLSKPLDAPISIILEYDPQCNILVHFQPLEGNLVSAQAIPLPVSALQPLLKQYFKTAKEFKSSFFADKEELFANLPLQATLTGATVNASYYSQLAKEIFADCKTLTDVDFKKQTSDPQVIAQGIAFSKAMSGDILSTHVYSISQYTSSQAATVLDQDVYAQQLQELVAVRMALATPNLLSSKYDSTVMQANAILRGIMNTKAPGVAANADEGAVLVLLELSGNMTLALVLCPDAYNIYNYSFACIPAPVDHVQTMLDAIQATPIQ